MRGDGRLNAAAGIVRVPEGSGDDGRDEDDLFVKPVAGDMPPSVEGRKGDSNGVRRGDSIGVRYGDPVLVDEIDETERSGRLMCGGGIEFCWRGDSGLPALVGDVDSLSGTNGVTGTGSVVIPAAAAFSDDSSIGSSKAGTGTRRGRWSPCGEGASSESIIVGVRAEEASAQAQQKQSKDRKADLHLALLEK